MEAVQTREAPPATSVDSFLFPSVAWFERLAEEMARNRALHEHLGYVDCVAQFTVLDGGPGGSRWSAQVTFEELGVTSVREVDRPEDADFVLEGSLETWREMIDNVAGGGGRPDLTHTLNYLSLLGTPMCVRSSDPVRRDLFFRFNQSFQEFFNASAAFATHAGPRAEPRP
jgi:hypothetical protein